MKISNLKHQKIKKQCLIAFNWLILLTIIISFGITGCVPNMNSTGKKQFQLSNANRSKSQKIKEREKQIQNINYDDEDNNSTNNSQINDVIEFEKKINSSSYSKKTANPKNINQQSISDNDKYETLKNEFDESIANVKEELIEIKRILGDVAADKIKPTAERNDYSNKAESSIIKGKEDNVLDKTFIIQSEEQKQQSKKEFTQPKKEIKSNKNFKVVKTSASEQIVNTKIENQSTNIQNSEPTPVTVSNNIINNNSAENNFTDVISKLAKGDYNSASKIVNDKLRQSKDPAVVSNCNYWLGEISFNQRDYAKSISYFNTALNNNCDKKDIAQARIAESYLRVGKNDEAKIAYQNLLKEYPKSTHSPKAKKMLQQL